MYRKTLDDQLGGKITSEKGAGGHLFNRDVLRRTDTVFILNGWGSVIMFDQYGFDAVCSTVGEGHWNREWNSELARVKRIYIAGDADNAGAEMVKKVRGEISWVREIYWPFPKGSKKDGRDFFLEGYTAEDLKKRMAAADRRGGNRLFLDGGKTWRRQQNGYGRKWSSDWATSLTQGR